MMKKITFFTLIVAALFATIAFADDDHDHDHDHDHEHIQVPCPTKGRLLVSDYLTNKVYVLDLDEATGTGSTKTLAIMATFDSIAPQATVYSTLDERWGIVVERNNNTVWFVDNGITIDDENLIDKDDPARSPLVLTGPRPTHIVSNADRVAVFFDGVAGQTDTSKASFVLESQLGSATATVRSINNIPTHHGVAIGLDDDYAVISHGPFLTNPTLPDGFLAYNLINSQVVANLTDTTNENANCPGYHGSAELQRGRWMLFGCAHPNVTTDEHDGILIVSFNRTTKTFTGHKASYPDAYENERTGSFAYSPFMDYVVGNYDGSYSGSTYRGYIQAPVETTTDFVAADILRNVSYTRCAYAQEPVADQHRLVDIGSDGVLRIYDPRNWNTAPRTVTVYPATPCTVNDGLHGDLKLVVVPGFAVISDPLRNAIKTVNLANLEITTYSVPQSIQISSMTLLGEYAAGICEEEASSAMSLKVSSALLMAILSILSVFFL